MLVSRIKDRIIPAFQALVQRAILHCIKFRAECQFST